LEKPTGVSASKASAAFNGTQCQVFFQRTCGPAVIKIKAIERREGLYLLLHVHVVGHQLAHLLYLSPPEVANHALPLQHLTSFASSGENAALAW